MFRFFSRYKLFKNKVKGVILFSLLLSIYFTFLQKHISKSNYLLEHSYSLFFNKIELSYEDLHSANDTIIYRSKYSPNDYLSVPQGGTVSGFYIFPDTVTFDSISLANNLITESKGMAYGSIVNLNNLEDGKYQFYFSACHWESRFKLTIKTK